MIAAVDIGNSNIVVGFVDDQRRVPVLRKDKDTAAENERRICHRAENADGCVSGDL